MPRYLGLKLNLPILEEWIKNISIIDVPISL